MTIFNSVRNPSEHEVEFEVTYEGDGLFGEPSLSVGAGDTVTYNLIYYPLTTGNYEGSIMFFNELVGEFWYK